MSADERRPASSGAPIKQVNETARPAMTTRERRPVTGGAAPKMSTQIDASPEKPSAGMDGSLTRVTANFTPRAIGALDRIAAQTGDSKTDILNRSVMIYEVILELLEQSGGSTLTVKLPDGEERLRFL